MEYFNISILNNAVLFDILTENVFLVYYFIMHYYVLFQY